MEKKTPPQLNVTLEDDIHPPNLIDISHTHTHTHKNEDCWVIFLTSCTDSSSWLARSGIAVLVEILLSSPTLCRSWYPDTNCWRITWSVEGSSRGLCSMPDRSLWNWLIDNVYIHYYTQHMKRCHQKPVKIYKIYVFISVLMAIWEGRNLWNATLPVTINLDFWHFYPKDHSNNYFLWLLMENAELYL